MSNALNLIAAERRRQIEIEGHSLAHDDEHNRGELMAAAACYISAAMCINAPDDPRAAPATCEPPVFPYWPWETSAYKASLSDAVPNLIKAAALIAAEIERLQRLSRTEDGIQPRSYYDVVRSMTADPDVLAAVDKAEAEDGTNG